MSSQGCKVHGKVLFHKGKPVGYAMVCQTDTQAINFRSLIRVSGAILVQALACWATWHHHAVQQNTLLTGFSGICVPADSCCTGIAHRASTTTGDFLLIQSFTPSCPDEFSPQANTCRSRCSLSLLMAPDIGLRAGTAVLLVVIHSGLSLAGGDCCR